MKTKYIKIINEQKIVIKLNVHKNKHVLNSLNLKMLKIN